MPRLPSEISARRIGALTCAVVTAGRIHWEVPSREPHSWRSDDVPIAPDGRAEIGVNWMAIVGPQATVLVDPVTWDGPQDLGDSDVFPDISLVDALAALEIDPAAVSHVVLTHGHIDHLTGLVDHDGEPRFPNADHHLPALDWPTLRASADDDDERRQIVGGLEKLEAAGRLVLSGTEVDVAPGVEVHWTGGETPGHQIVRAASGAEDVLYLGDLVHFPNEVEHPEWVALEHRDDAEVVAARERWYAHAADHATSVVFTHARFPAWGRFERTDTAFAWRYDAEV